MGEVGTELPEKTTESSSSMVNGEVNGVCKEKMEIDTEEESQSQSSENGLNTEINSTSDEIKSKISKESTTESDVGKISNNNIHSSTEAEENPSSTAEKEDSNENENENCTSSPSSSPCPPSSSSNPIIGNKLEISDKPEPMIIDDVEDDDSKSYDTADDNSKAELSPSESQEDPTPGDKEDSVDHPDTTNKTEVENSIEKEERNVDSSLDNKDDVEMITSEEETKENEKVSSAVVSQKETELATEESDIRPTEKEKEESNKDETDEEGEKLLINEDISMEEEKKPEEKSAEEDIEIVEKDPLEISGEKERNTKVEKSVTSVSDDVHIIDSDDDENEAGSFNSKNTENSSGTTAKQEQEENTSKDKIRGSESDIPKKSTSNLKEMETDISKINTNSDKENKSSIHEDISGTVVIPSDSDNEAETTVPLGKRNDSTDKNEVNKFQVTSTTTSANSTAESNKNIGKNIVPLQPINDKDDDDDCVLIEDDDKDETSVTTTATTLTSNSVSSRKGNRQRKSVVKVREFASYDDDDVTEVLDDSQPPAKRQKVNPITNVMGGVNNMSSAGQLTIKDARTLMGPFIDNSMKTNISQSFASSTGAGGFSSMKVGLSNAGNVSGITTNTIAQGGIYPVSIRPALVPLSQPPKLVSTTSSISTLPTITNAALLPALTDDMFVLEAPSFIVPYIYEKPPSESLKEVVTKLSEEVEKLKKELEEKMQKEGDKEKTDKDGAGDNSSQKDGLNQEEIDKQKDDLNDKKRKRKKRKNPDDSWDESDESTDDDASDSEMRMKILIKEDKTDINTIKSHLAVTPNSLNSTSVTSSTSADDKKTDNYFESPLGKFFMDIGLGLVQEYVQSDLLRIQKRKRDKLRDKDDITEMEKTITALKQNLEDSRKRNEPFKFEMKRCEYCNFKSESALTMAHHYETPHMRQNVYKCNFCTFESRPAPDILFHMEAVHNIKGRLEKAPSYYQCPNCPFEDNGKSKLARHTPVCAKKFRPETNLLPPHDFEAPAKIPRIKPRHGLVGTATAYQAMAAQAAAQKAALASMQQRGITPNNNNAMNRNRGRPQTITKVTPSITGVPMGTTPVGTTIRGMGATTSTQPVPLRPPIPSGMVLPNNYQMVGNQLIQVAGSNLAILSNTHNAMMLQQTQQQQFQQQQQQIPQQQLQNFNKKTIGGQQPSISITPLPRQPANVQPTNTNNQTIHQPVTLTSGSVKGPGGMKPGQSPAAAAAAAAGGKAVFVICEICDGYIKDLEQLRNHMQWMHKVKIHPKMIYNRPPLNCQKCQYRFFTDQGLERHLLGSHGLVTSSMQEAANKGKDAGRCPVCGRLYQWKLLNHVSRDHHMTLKPAHLSYKCTVCTATFGMYKQFENHVYTAHSSVAKKAMDGKKNSGPGNSSSNNSNNSSSSNNNSNSNNISGNNNYINSNSGNSSNHMIGNNMTGIGNIANALNHRANLIGSNSGAGTGSNSILPPQLSGNDPLLKPLKINDEITIIPQPATKSRNISGNNSNSSNSTSITATAISSGAGGLISGDYESHILGKSSSSRRK